MIKNFLVSVADALSIISQKIKPGRVTLIKTSHATGYVLAKTIKTPFHSPPFDQSAMDGYAFRFNDLKQGNTITIIGEAAAGKNFSGKIKKNQSVRIFTGAEVPAGTDTVVMQEKVAVDAGVLKIHDTNLNYGSNVRKAGSQLKKGQVAVEKNVLLKPGAIGFIAAFGIDKISVYRKPVVAIIVTGDELISPGKKLKPGQIFESNSTALCALLNADGIQDVKCYQAKDSLVATKSVFKKAFLKSDFIIFTGGVSVGDYDFVIEAIRDEKVKTGFYKVKQKPGKPLFFGTKEKKYIFGLPGNPAAVLSCYYEFVRPAINLFQNNPNPLAATLQLPLTTAVNKKPGLVHFLKAYTNFATVTPLPGQESYLMQSFIAANCFIVLDEFTENKKAGEIVTVHLF